MPLPATTHKLRVSILACLEDRVRQAHRIQLLADLIREGAATLNLNASWAST